MMCHCRLVNTEKKCMQKLHSDGILESFDSESVEKCEACLLGKMIKIPFEGFVERESDIGNHAFRCVWFNEYTSTR